MKRLFLLALLLVLVCGLVGSAQPAQAQGFIEYFPMWLVCVEQAVAKGDIIVFSDASYLFTCTNASTPENVDTKSIPHLWQYEDGETAGCIIEKVNQSKFSMTCTYSPPPSTP